MTQEARSHGTYLFDIEVSINFSRVFCRFIYLQANLCFCLIIKFLVFFQCFLISFLFPVCFYIFHLAKLLLALDAFIVIPVNLNFFLNQVRKVVPTIAEPINLLACLISLILQLIFCIIHPLREAFHPCNHRVHGVIRLWYFFKLILLIAPYTHYLIFL